MPQDESKGKPVNTALSTNLRHERGTDAIKAERAAHMLEVEDEILQSSMCIVQALLAFTEVRPRDPANPEKQNPPEDWVQKYGLEAAEQRLLLAERGWDPAAKEPAGSVAARHLVIGIAKARGQKGTVRTPEVNVRISLPAPKSASFSQPKGSDLQDGTAVIYPSRVLDE